MLRKDVDNIVSRQLSSMGSSLRVQSNPGQLRRNKCQWTEGVYTHKIVVTVKSNEITTAKDTIVDYLRAGEGNEDSNELRSRGERICENPEAFLRGFRMHGAGLP